jgi:BirA family biotin operon repressor/biotin-[acetyl-CoA-carboxylase] ligase
VTAGRPAGTIDDGAGEGGPEPWRLKVFEHLPSTADLCRRLAEAGEPGGLAIVALRQSAGRGTRGRSWEGAAGNLFMSVLLRPAEPSRNAAQWSLLAGVALADVLSRYVPEPAVLALKWPNDVLMHGRKLAGILVESAADDAGCLAWLSIGVGVNLAAAPDVVGRDTACLAEHVAPPAPEAVAADMLEAIAHWRARRLAEGFAPVRAAFLARAQAPGTPLTLRLGERTLGGTFEGLGEDGSLLVRTDGRVHAFAAGEVTIGNGA